MSVVERAVCFASSVGAAASEPKKLNKLIKMSGSVLGTALELIVKRRILHKLLNKKNNNTPQPLHNTVMRHQSVQSEASLTLLQHRTVQEVLPAHITE